MLKITIFTPTYNRAYTLNRLYTSLINQHDLDDFEWIIVDDGSSDNSKELIESFIIENKIEIHYFFQSNKGKQQAINLGVQQAKGDLFFIVDSDDYLKANALELVTKEWATIKSNNHFAGLCLRKMNFSSNEMIGNPLPTRILDSNSLEILYYHNITGDKAEIFRTSILTKNTFPVFKGEKFVPEGLIWNRIAEKYQLRFVDEGIYMCEYLNDGYSKNFMQNLKSNPRGFRVYYSNLLKYKIVPFNVKVKALIRIIQTLIFQSINNIQK